MEDLTLRQLLADYHGLSPEEVTPELFDPAVKFLKDNHPGPSDSGVWVLDTESQDSLLGYLESRATGEVVEAGEEESDPWDEFILWASKFYEDPRFDQNERDYKLEIAENIRSARSAIEADSEDWHQLLKKAFGAPNNLTYYITHSRFLDWASEEPQTARRVIMSLWDEGTDLAVRVDEFAQAMPELISTPGAKVELASFLLLADPVEYAMYRPTPIKMAVELTESEEIPDRPESEIYLTALHFFDTFIEEAAKRGLAIRDRLDAQGLIWTIAKVNPGPSWPDEEAEAFLRYRGERPQVWWVNQGETYHRELEHSVVSAGITNRAGQVLQHHKNVSLLRKGDVILHHAAGFVRAISIVTHKPEIKPRSWEKNGDPLRITRTRYFELPEGIEVRGMDQHRRTPEAGPFDRYGGVKQVYLVPLSVDFSEWLRTSYSDRWPEGSPWAAKQRNTWLFQANPQVWDLARELAQMDEGDEDTFSVSRFKAEYAIGDRVLLWSAGERAGLYAIGQISGELFELGDDDERFTNTDVAVPWRLISKVEPPLARANLMDNPVLKGLSVITAPQGTNFRVTDEQWAEIRRLLSDDPLQPGEPKTLSEIGTYILDQGLIISDRTLRRFHVSLRTRGFVILSGISGTGKTWLTEVYADAIGAEYLLVPVAPNWTTNEDLLGYRNPLDNHYYDTPFSRFLRRAADEYADATDKQREPNPFLLCLDEMNLARVEYYFAKFLSTMEVRSRHGTADLELSAEETVRLTPNLWFVGTVNVDETTHGFADKVFDRAQLIEMEAPRDAIASHIGQAAFRDTLLEVYDSVADAKAFGFRVVDEIKNYVAESEPLDVEWHEAIDEQILQKVLTKLTGSEPAIRFALEQMLDLAEQNDLELTRSKARKMLDAYDRDGFTSYF